MTTSNQTNTKTAEQGLSAKTATTSQSNDAKAPKTKRQPKLVNRRAQAGQSRLDRHFLLRKNFLMELSALLDAENQLIQALPQFARAASDQSLKQAINHHLTQTKEHAKRIQVIFKASKAKFSKKNSSSMRALVAEARPFLAKRKKKPAMDSQIIAIAQKIEHYEIAAYGTLRSWAFVLGDRKAWELVSQTLEEEKHADYSLTMISEDAVDVPVSEDNQTETAHQERSDNTMPTQQNHGRRSGRGSQERDENGRFENHNGGRQNQSSSSRGRSHNGPSGRQENFQGARYSDRNQERGSSAGNYERNENENYGRQGSSRNQGDQNRGEYDRFENGNSQGGQNYSSGSSNQNWNDENNWNDDHRSQSSQYRDRNENGRFQNQENENQSYRGPRNQDWNDNDGNERQGHNQSHNDQNRSREDSRDENSGRQNYQDRDEDRDNDRQNSGQSGSSQGWNNDYDNQSQRNRRSHSQGRSSREHSSYN